LSALSRLENARGIPKSAARSFRVAGVDDENAATRHGSKVFMNRLVERVAGPMIWIVNDIERLGPAAVRRMNPVMRFPKQSFPLSQAATL